MRLSDLFPFKRRGERSHIGVELSGVHAKNINIRDVKVGYTAEELIAALEKSGLLGVSDFAGIQRQTIMGLAHRMKPKVRDFDQAVVVLERAVDIALELPKSERSAGGESFIKAVLERLGEKLRS